MEKKSPESKCFREKGALLKEIVKAIEKDKGDDDGDYIGHIDPHPFPDLRTGTFVGFRSKFMPAPAVAHRAEQSDDQTAQGQQKVVYQEIFKVHDT